MFYMCMVQEKSGSNQSATDVPQCKHTYTHTPSLPPCFKDGPGDTTPKFHKH